MTDKMLRHAIRHVASPLQTILELLKEKGDARNKKYNIVSEKVKEGAVIKGYKYSLVMTEDEEAGMPAEVCDCGKIEIVEQEEEE